MFKYSAFTENTPEMREYLEKIRRKRIGSEIGNLIMVVEDKFMCFELEGNIGTNFSDAVNCLGNPDLFKAVTAVRDDKIESEQYYVCDQEKGYYNKDEYITLCKEGEFIKNPLSKFTSFVGHKATLPELVEHFKK